MRRLDRTMVKRYFAAARERYRILLLRRQGAEWPWTEDPVFREFRFTNVFREDDKTTVWFRENIRNPLREQPEVLLATMVFRAFNRIETGELLKDLLLGEWNTSEAERRLRAVADAGVPYVTGAYMVRSENGLPKFRGILEAVDAFIECVDVERVEEFRQLRSAHSYLVGAPYLGGFTTYEIVTDLRWTYLLEDANDIMTWCHVGPGATRGLGRLTGGGASEFQQGRDQEAMLPLLEKILDESLKLTNWPGGWPAWSMREVEHWLCEFDKYERARLGEGKMKRKYQP